MQLKILINNQYSEKQKSPYWSIFFNPAVPLATYLCLSPMFSFFSEQFGIRHPAYLLLGYLAVCLIQPGLWDGRLIERIRPIDYVYAVFVLIVLISWVVTGRAGGNRVIAYFFAIMTIPWIAVRLLTASQIKDIVHYTVLFGSVIAVGYLITTLFMYGFDASGNRVILFGRYTVYLNFGPAVGFLAVMSAVYLIFPSAARSGHVHKAGWVMLPLSLIVLVHMGGRGLIVSVILALFAGFAIVRQSTWKRKIVVMLVVLTSIIVGLASLPKNRFDHFSQLQDVVNFLPTISKQDIAMGPNDSIAIRVQISREAVVMFLRNPVYGVGVGRFGLESSYFGSSAVLASPHSTVLHILSELGLTGTAPFIVLNLMLLAIARSITRVQLNDSTPWLGSVVVTVWFYVVIYDQFNGNYLNMLYYYFFSSLLVRLYITYRKEEMVTKASLPAHSA
jgi:O-antigen ligase